jgi:hypothetical protein
MVWLPLMAEASRSELVTRHLDLRQATPGEDKLGLFHPTD